MAFPENDNLDDNQKLTSFFNDSASGDDPAPGQGEGDQGEGEGGEGSPIQRAEYDRDHPYYQGGDDPEGGDQGEGDEGDQGDQGEQGRARDDKGRFKTNKENPDRFEFWQSKYNKMEEMNERLMAQLEKQANGQGEEGQGQGQQKSPQEVLQTKQAELKELSIPSKPSKPSDYNPEEAYTNPDSASFKYRASMDEYNETFAEVMSKRDQLKDEIYDIKLETLQKPVREMAQEKQLSAQQKKTVDSLKENYQFTDEQALDFVDEMSKPESMSMDNLVKFYRVTKGVKSSGSNRTNQQEDNRSRRREAAPPIPNGSGAGTSRNTDDDEAELGKAFGEGMLSFNR